MMHRPPTPAPNRPDDSNPEEMSYVQALYITFGKVIFGVFAVVHMFAAAWIVKLIWPDPVGYAYGVAFLLAVPVAYLNLEWLARRFGLDNGPIVDWHMRSTYLLIGGYTIALALATTLAVQETSSRAAARARELANERERARMRELTNSPSYKAAEEFLRARKKQQEQQDR